MPVPHKRSLVVKCTSCLKLRPISSFPRSDLRILQRNRLHVALCNSCRVVCRNCGQLVLNSSPKSSTLLSSASSMSSSPSSGSSGVPIRGTSYPKMSPRRDRMEREIAQSLNMTGGAIPGQQNKRTRPSVTFGTDSSPSSRRSNLNDSDDDFSSSSSSSSQLSPAGGDGVICDMCAERAALASTNVFYRFPMLRYKQCPFSVDKYRKIIWSEVKSLRRK